MLQIQWEQCGRFYVIIYSRILNYVNYFIVNDLEPHLSNHCSLSFALMLKHKKKVLQRICPLCKTGLGDEEHFLMNCIAYRDPRRELFNKLKKETNLFLDSMTPSSAFATLISMK